MSSKTLPIRPEAAVALLRFVAELITDHRLRSSSYTDGDWSCRWQPDGSDAFHVCLTSPRRLNFLETTTTLIQMGRSGFASLKTEHDEATEFHIRFSPKAEMTVFPDTVADGSVRLVAA